MFGISQKRIPVEKHKSDDESMALAKKSKIDQKEWLMRFVVFISFELFRGLSAREAQFRSLRTSPPHTSPCSHHPRPLRNRVVFVTNSEED